MKNGNDKILGDMIKSKANKRHSVLKPERLNKKNLILLMVTVLVFCHLGVLNTRATSYVL